MTRGLKAQQESLAGRVWGFSDHRAALSRQLAEVELAQYQAIVVAEPHAVRQVRLAHLAGVIRARVCQIVASMQVQPESAGALQQRWYKMLEWPTDHLRAVRDGWNRRSELAYGMPGTLGAFAPENL